ncbi:MAG TPA: glycosyltransferase family 4 protein [Mycobacteriales bacterium]|nr:glycosyltransferase family 4 protein [Mycobacteriales bacterium]
MSFHLIVPEGFDDPARPSGGNHYDRRLAGPALSVATVAGSRLDCALAAVPDGEPALIDGLIASGSAAVLGAHARRLSPVVLMHMPLFCPGEQEVLAAAAGVITTSAWTRDQLLARYPLDPDRVRIACPGADPAPLASGTPGGGSLLCVAAVAPHKGQDLLIAALDQLSTWDWSCRCAGSVTVDPGFAAGLRHDRVEFTGVLAGTALERAYADADVLLVPSRAETYGMVVTEALARGVPVLAAEVGGLPEALGYAPGGTRPGRLFAPEDPAALAAAIRGWLGDPAERCRLRAAARARRTALPGWEPTVTAVTAAMLDFAAVGAEL